MPRIVNLWKHPKTGILYFDAVVPADVKKPGVQARYKRSLGTRDPNEAERRWSAQKAAYELWLASLRGHTVDLTDQQIEALAGIWYRRQKEEHSTADVRGDDPLSDASGSIQDALDEGRRLATLNDDARSILEEHRIPPTSALIARLSDRLHVRCLDLFPALQRWEHGDYGHDSTLDQFPPWHPSTASGINQSDSAGTRAAATLDHRSGAVQGAAGWLRHCFCALRLQQSYQNARVRDSNARQKIDGKPPCLQCFSYFRPYGSRAHEQDCTRSSQESTKGV